MSAYGGRQTQLMPVPNARYPSHVARSATDTTALTMRAVQPPRSVGADGSPAIEHRCLEAQSSELALAGPPLLDVLEPMVWHGSR